MGDAIYDPFDKAEPDHDSNWVAKKSFIFADINKWQWLLLNTNNDVVG